MINILTKFVLKLQNLINL